MKMVQEFALDRIEGRPGSEAREEPRARLRRAGKDTGTVVPGAVLEAQLASDKSVVFDFFGDHAWRVTLLDKPQFRFPVARLTEPAGVHRRFGFTRHFAVAAARRAA